MSEQPQTVSPEQAREARIEVTKLSVGDNPQYDSYGVSVYGLDGFDHTPLVLRDALSPREAEIMADGLRGIFVRHAAPLRARIAELEQENAAARGRGKLVAQALGVQEVDGVMRNVRAEALAQQVTKLQQALRKELWLNHGHSLLYGDDGEMQCPECRADFKRDPLAELQQKAFLAKAAASTRGGQHD